MAPKNLDGHMQLCVRIPLRLKRQIKILAVEKEETVSHFVVQAIAAKLLREKITS